LPLPPYIYILSLHDALPIFDSTTPAKKREMALEILDRPFRVCGMVPNTGEPGGGPFWVRGADGSVTLQIVEGGQVDPASETQKKDRKSTRLNSSHDQISYAV